MKKWMIALGTALLLQAGTALANPDDTRSSITARYGDYRLVIDSDNQTWTKEEWLNKGMKRAKPSAYMHGFTTNGLHVQMEVSYLNANPDALVSVQRFTPDMAIRIKDFKQYFPEVYALLVSPKAHAFTTYSSLSKNFLEPVSPVTMGILVEQPSAPARTSACPLIAFNIQDEGRFIKDPSWINSDIYIREFVITSIYRNSVKDHFDQNTGDWADLKNYFK